MSLDDNLRSFLHYRGDQHNRLGMDNASLTYAADALLLGVVLMMLVRNTLLNPHPIAWLLAAILLAYVALFALRPARLLTWRVTLMAVGALAVAMAIPLRLDDHVLVTSFLACLGCMAMFFARGAIPALASVAVYIVFLAVMLQIPAHGYKQPGHIITTLISTTVVFVVALLLQHHFMQRLENSIRTLSDTKDYLQQSIDGLHHAAAAGSVGIWSFRRDDERWNSNGIFRDLMDLPAIEHPTLTSALVRERLSDDTGDGFMARIRSDEDAEYELLDILKRDGSRLRCQVMSRVYHPQDGSMIRRGVLVAFPGVGSQNQERTVATN